MKKMLPGHVDQPHPGQGDGGESRISRPDIAPWLRPTGHGRRQRVGEDPEIEERRGGQIATLFGQVSDPRCTSIKEFLLPYLRPRSVGSRHDPGTWLQTQARVGPDAHPGGLRYEGDGDGAEVIVPPHLGEDVGSGRCHESCAEQASSAQGTGEDLSAAGPGPERSTALRYGGHVGAGFLLRCTFGDEGFRHGRAERERKIG